MEMRTKNTCEELYWETAKKAVADCKVVAMEILRLCRSIFRIDEERALEKRYGHLFKPYGEGNVGGKILDRMVALSLPAYQNDLAAIEDMLDNPYHAELNAYCYFQRGHVLVETHTLPTFDWETYHELREWDFAKSREIWEVYEEEKRNFFLAVAEELWDFDGFAQRYAPLVSMEEIEAYHEYCKKIFIEERIFLQPEWLLFSCVQWRGKESFLYENPCTDFFLQAHSESLALLPDCVWKGKALKDLLLKRYKMKLS